MDFILITLISGGLSIPNPPNQVAQMQMNADTTTDEFNANLVPKVKTVSSQYCMDATNYSNYLKQRKGRAETKRKTK